MRVSSKMLKEEQNFLTVEEKQEKRQMTMKK